MARNVMSEDPLLIQPFSIEIEESVLSDLRYRIRRTAWPDTSYSSGWDYGADSSYLKSLLATWANDFDWRGRERELNRLPQYRCEIDGLKIHFVHERGDGPSPLPIVLTHGFPSSFLEHLRLAELLARPAAHGGRAEDAFDVVVTSLPGYGFSDPPQGPVLERTVGDLWYRLMRDGLGYRRFGAHGSDVGTGATMQLALHHPDSVVGIHMSAFYLDPPPRPWPPAVLDFIEHQQQERAEDVAYSRMQSTRPLTAAYGLTDSPAGLAAWIVDLFRAFSDCGGDIESRFSREDILTNLTIYWATRCIGSAMRGYYDYAHFEPPTPPDARVDVPAGFAVFADSYRAGTVRPPRAMAEHQFNVTRWTEMPRGGHFAALEEPELLANEIRKFFRPLRP
jgi:pimeloyl-ACP methyl ester carboxylesterase